MDWAFIDSAARAVVIVLMIAAVYALLKLIGAAFRWLARFRISDAARSAGRLTASVEDSTRAVRSAFKEGRGK